jgi:spermidine dehydrogenase
MPFNIAVEIDEEIALYRLKLCADLPILDNTAMGKKRDTELGMRQAITRRDVLHGFGAAAAAAFVPGTAFADQVLAAEKAGQPYYPAGLTGMRGNHDGSYEVAHALARTGQRDWGPVIEPDSEVYDLVVVGAGLSGLAAAHFFLRDYPDAHVLLLDNHDDFGGHAKRNEFNIDGKTLLGYGGSQSFEAPSSYPDIAKSLLRDLGVDIGRLGDTYDQDFYKRHGLKPVIHFDKEIWGADRVVPFELGPTVYVPFANGDTPEKVVSQMPISEDARKEFHRLLTIDEDQLNMSANQEEEYLYRISYRDFLQQHVGITEPEVFAILQDLTLDFGAGIDAVSADDALNWSGLPGSGATGHAGVKDEEPYIYHFPDGNASVARLLVRSMIPDVTESSTIEDIVDAKFDYNKLDDSGSPVRLRLNTTVVRVQHEGTSRSAKKVAVDYVENGQAQRVYARHCVLACYNSIIPSLCPELPAEQREALAMPAKTPNLYTNVALRNWRAWKQLGIGGGVSPGSYHPKMMIDFPVSFGGQKFPDDPEQPIIVHMERFPHRNNEGLSPREQKRLGRHELLATPFEAIERNIRQQLSSLLSAGDFDPARDIAGITVNRWAHGYADGFWDFGDPWLGDSNDERKPHVRGRKPFGRITIANSDAGGSAMFEAAVSQAHRAVQELKK